jgi:hypothetical protein
VSEGGEEEESDKTSQAFYFTLIKLVLFIFLPSCICLGRSIQTFGKLENLSNFPNETSLLSAFKFKILLKYVK